MRLNTDTIAVGIMVPYPGTKVYEWAKQNRFGYKLRSTDWDDYDKFGSSALEIERLPVNKLEGFQRSAYIRFYLKNFRVIDLLRFIISRHKGILAVLKRQLGRKKQKASHVYYCTVKALQYYIDKSLELVGLKNTTRRILNYFNNSE